MKANRGPFVCYGSELLQKRTWRDTSENTSTFRSFEFGTKAVEKRRKVPFTRFVIVHHMFPMDKEFMLFLDGVPARTELLPRLFGCSSSSCRFRGPRPARRQ